MPNNPKSPWSKIIMYIGVNQSMERVLGIVIYPITVNDNNIFKGIVGISKPSTALSGTSISDFSSVFIQSLCQEFYSRHLTAAEPENTDIVSLRLDRTGIIMEPSYIRDLQLAFGKYYPPKFKQLSKSLLSVLMT